MRECPGVENEPSFVLMSLGMVFGRGDFGRLTYCASDLVKFLLPYALADISQAYSELVWME